MVLMRKMEVIWDGIIRKFTIYILEKVKEMKINEIVIINHLMGHIYLN